MKSLPNPATLIEFIVNNCEMGSMSALGDFIRTRRKSLGLTQTALAIRIGVDDTYVSAVETGKRTPDGEQFLGMMSAALELNGELASELATAARKSQRIFRLPAEISTLKHDVLQALALDSCLSDEDMRLLAAMHAGLARGRHVPAAEHSPPNARRTHVKKKRHTTQRAGSAFWVRTSKDSSSDKAESLPI